MTPPLVNLLSRAESAGVRLWGEGIDLHFRAPGSLPGDLRAQFIANKSALLAVLAEWDAPAALRLMHLADGVADGRGDDAAIQREADRFLSAYLAGDMAGVRKACALVEERARKLVEAESQAGRAA